MKIMQSGLRSRHLAALVAIGLFVIALISWWTIYQVRKEHAGRERAGEVIQRSIAVAQLLLNGHQGPVDPDSFLAEQFPALIYSPIDGSRGVRDTRRHPILLGELRPDMERIAETEGERRGAVRMFMAEGAVFIALQLVGIAIVFGALRREVRLKRQQENFISAVTHELKSPLTSLELFAQTLLSHDLDADKRREILGKMLGDTRRLEELVSNLLDASRAVTGRFSPEPETIDLGPVVESLLKELSGYLAEHHARVDIDAPTGTRVTADRRYVQAIVRNLVQNAVKYTNHEPIIHVRTKRNGSQGVLVIADEGIGLPREDQDAIFQKFYRVGDEMVRTSKGSGLGLYLAREMARAMDGTITAESPGPGCGATMRLFLPLRDD